LEANDTLFITVTTAVRRGFDPDQSAPFQSGRWTLETTGGYVLESAGSTFDFAVPGSFSVLFPLGGRTRAIPTVLRLHETWQRRDHFEPVDLGTVETPFELAEPIDVDLGSSTLRIDALVLAAEFGSMHWFMTDDRLAVVGGYITVGDQAQPRYWYADSGDLGFDPFGGVFLDPRGSSGVVDFLVDSPGGEPASGPGALALNVTVVDALPASAEFDVTDLVIER
jgi:hypothetical protein